MPEGQTKENKNNTEEYTKIIIGIYALLVIVSTIYFLFSDEKRTDSEKLEIIANLSPSGTPDLTPSTESDSSATEPIALVDLRGRVIYKGDPVSNAQVWTIIEYGDGNRDSPSGTTTNQQGEFLIGPIRKTRAPISEFLPPDIEEVIINSKAQILRENQETITVNGEETLFIFGKGDTRRGITPNVGAILFLPAIFLLSLFVPFSELNALWKYTISIILAFLLTVTMIGVISMGLHSVHTAYDDNELLILGFGSLFQGSYVEGIGNEWLFSLTSNNQWSSQYTNIVGLGAPLWVILLAVIGAGLLTVSIIVSGITDRPDFDKLQKTPPDEDELRKFRQRIEKFVRHQFYILFSPLGAIFIYQLLVAADAARQHVTVAIAALGAGASLNFILSQAIKRSRGALEDTNSSKQQG